MGASSADGCQIDADCAYGVYDHELGSPADCLPRTAVACSCTFLPQSRATIARRAEADRRLCGPILAEHAICKNECQVPGPARCVGGRCAAGQ